MSKKPKTEHRLTIRTRHGNIHHYPKPHRQSADKALTDFYRDQTRSPYLTDAEAWIETRTVTAWTPLRQPETEAPRILPQSEHPNAPLEQHHTGPRP